MFVRRDKSQKTTVLTGWIVRYDGFIFGSNCSGGMKMVVCRCRTWKRNSGSTCQNHFIFCQTSLQHQSSFFLDKKNWKSASDRHCDVIFGFYMVKFVVKWHSEVKTWYLQPRIIPRKPLSDLERQSYRDLKKVIQSRFLPLLWHHLMMIIVKLDPK